MRGMAPYRRSQFFFFFAHPSLSYPYIPSSLSITQCQKKPNPAAQILASASYDDTIKLYVDDPSEDWFCFTTLKGHTSTVWSLAWAPDGRYLASASDDRTVRVWKRVEEHNWICALVLEGHERTVYSVSWSPGKVRSSTNEGGLGWLASSGSDGTINVWELFVSVFYNFSSSPD